MTENAKTVRTRRLAEALRANLKRRKTAAAKSVEPVSEPALDNPTIEMDGRSKG